MFFKYLNPHNNNYLVLDHVLNRHFSPAFFEVEERN